MSYSGWKYNQVPGLGDILMDAFGYIIDGFFVEVGAFDCQQWSPSYPLARLGWSGIFFEPQLDLYYECVKKFSESYPRVTIVNKAISNYVGATDLYLGGSLSTINREARDLYMDIPGLQSTGLGDGISETVQVSTLDTELVERMAPENFELLVIDVEGEEINVLNGFSIEIWAPWIVIVEAHEQFPDERLAEKAVPINEYMDRVGFYDKIYSDHINNVYRRNG